LVLQLAQPSQFGDAHPRELPPPAVEGLLGDPQLAAHLNHRGARFGLAQGVDDLLFRERFSRHAPSSSGCVHSNPRGGPVFRAQTNGEKPTGEDSPSIVVVALADPHRSVSYSGVIAWTTRGAG